LVLNTKDHKTGQHPLKNRPGGKKTPKPEKRGSGATSAEIAMHQAYSSAFSHDQDPKRSSLWLSICAATQLSPAGEEPPAVFGPFAMHDAKRGCGTVPPLLDIHP
jgi:hypothetical protein